MNKNETKTPIKKLTAFCSEEELKNGHMKDGSGIPFMLELENLSDEEISKTLSALQEVVN